MVRLNEPKDISALSKDFVNFLKQTPNNELPLRLVLYSHFSDTSFPQLVIIICKGGENKASTILDNTARLLSTTPYCTCLEQLPGHAELHGPLPIYLPKYCLSTSPPYSCLNHQTPTNNLCFLYRTFQQNFQSFYHRSGFRVSDYLPESNSTRQLIEACPGVTVRVPDFSY